MAEFHESKSIEELADIFEVAFALAAALKGDVSVPFVDKRNERGGFDKKIFLEEVKEND